MGSSAINAAYPANSSESRSTAMPSTSAPPNPKAAADLNAECERKNIISGTMVSTVGETGFQFSEISAITSSIRHTLCASSLFANTAIEFAHKLSK
ncbi:MAG: hypothetical protein ACREEK_25580 [Bradyrhizobium sp.]